MPSPARQIPRLLSPPRARLAHARNRIGVEHDLGAHAVRRPRHVARALPRAAGADVGAGAAEEGGGAGGGGAAGDVSVVGAEGVFEGVEGGGRGGADVEAEADGAGDGVGGAGREGEDAGAGEGGVGGGEAVGVED